MAKILMVVAQDGFRDEELFVPKEMLEKEGHKVMVASVTRARAKGSKGAAILPDIAIYEANPEFFSAIIVVGGPGSPALSENRELLGLLEKANKMEKIVAAICLGPMALAKAGVLFGKKATVYPDNRGISALRDADADYTTDQVVEDGRIITADSPASAEGFAQRIIEALKS